MKRTRLLSFFGLAVDPVPGPAGTPALLDSRVVSRMAGTPAGLGLVLVSGLAFALGCAGAKPPPTPAEPPPSTVLPAASPTDRKFGGRVVTAPSDLPLVAIRIAFQAGSIDDPKGKEGLTALTARMLAEGGTLELTSGQLLEALFPIAASIGVQTGKELTVFSGQVHRDHVDRYAPLLTAALTRPRWDPKEFARMREDALQALEKGLRSGDDEELGKAALDTVMWRGHPYAHPELGTVQGLRALTLEDVQAQAARIFAQDRLLIGVGGAVDQRVVDALRQDLAVLPATSPELVALPAPAPGPERVLVVAKDADSTAISMGYPWALRRGDPDFFPMMVAISALGEHRQFVGRLQKELRVKRGLNYGNYAYVEHFEQEGWGTYPALNIGRRQQDFTVWLRPVPAGHGLFATRAALYQLERFRAGITPEEFETIRGFLSGYTLLLGQTPMRRLGYAMDSVYYGTLDHLTAFRERLGTMKVEEVNAAIARWVKPELVRVAVVAKDAQGLQQAMASGAPSPIAYAAEKPDPGLLAEDQKFVGLPLVAGPGEVRVEPVGALFER